MKRIFIIEMLIIVISCMIVSWCTRSVIKNGKQDKAEEKSKISADVKSISDESKEKGTPDFYAGNKISDVKDQGKVTGKYLLDISGFTGILFLSSRDGVFYGTIQFTNWGSGISQPLKDLRINDDKIFFVRSVTTPAELKKYGGERYYKQLYHGIFSTDGSFIKGYYTDSGTETNWQAVRK